MNVVISQGRNWFYQWWRMLCFILCFEIVLGFILSGGFLNTEELRWSLEHFLPHSFLCAYLFIYASNLDSKRKPGGLPRSFFITTGLLSVFGFVLFR